MNIRKQNTTVEISELGLKIEIKADLLLSALISESTKNLLGKMIEDRLKYLLEYFKEVYNRIEVETNDEFFNFLKENQDSNIYEYACLNRDLYALFGDIFEQFYEDNSDVMCTIGRIYKYSDVYGFKSVLGTIIEL